MTNFWRRLLGRATVEPQVTPVTPETRDPGYVETYTDKGEAPPRVIPFWEAQGATMYRSEATQEDFVIPGDVGTGSSMTTELPQITGTYDPSLSLTRRRSLSDIERAGQNKGGGKENGGGQVG